MESKTLRSGCALSKWPLNFPPRLRASIPLRKVTVVLMQHAAIEWQQNGICQYAVILSTQKVTCRYQRNALGLQSCNLQEGLGQRKTSAKVNYIIMHNNATKCSKWNICMDFLERNQWQPLTWTRDLVVDSLGHLNAVIASPCSSHISMIQSPHPPGTKLSAKPLQGNHPNRSCHCLFCPTPGQRLEGHSIII